MHGFLMNMETPDGGQKKMDSKMTFSYRTINGVEVGNMYSIVKVDDKGELGTGTLKLEYSELEVNQPIDEALFEKPTP